MRRRRRPSNAVDPASGVFWFANYPAADAGRAVEVAWQTAFSRWCTDRDVDVCAVCVEAERLGVADQPFNPY